MARNTGGQQTLPAKTQQQNGGGQGTSMAVVAAKEVQSFLESQRDRVAGIMPPSLGLSPERMIKLACIAVHKTPNLLSCDRLSILSAVLEAAGLGLEIGGPLAEAHLVPYGKVCQMQPDYKGLLKLARRSGEFEVIEAVEVFERDEFQYERTPAPSILHKPCVITYPGQITHVYAYAILKGGHMVCEVMRADQVEEIRQRSKAKDSLMWSSYWGEGAKKTVLKRFLKRQARSVEVAQAIEADDREYVTQDGEVVTVRRVAGRERGVAGLRSQLQIEADAPAMPPQPSAVYSEAEDAGAEAEESAGDTGDGGQLEFPDEPGARG